MAKLTFSDFKYVTDYLFTYFSLNEEQADDMAMKFVATNDNTTDAAIEAFAFANGAD